MKRQTHQFNEEKDFLVAIYIGFLKHEEFVKISNDSLKLMVKYGTSKLLVDTSKLKVMPPENQEWIQESWFPRAMDVGLKKMAFITPENIFGEVSAKNANEKANQLPLDLAYFSDYLEAETWLLS